MGTQGLIALPIKGGKRGLLNVYVLYHSGLGVATVLFILMLKDNEYAVVQEKLEALEWIDDGEAQVPPADLEHLKIIGTTNNALRDPCRVTLEPTTWLEAFVGAGMAVSLALIYAGKITKGPNSGSFYRDTLFCEYVYRLLAAWTFSIKRDESQDDLTGPTGRKQTWSFDKLKDIQCKWHIQAIDSARIILMTGLQQQIFQELHDKDTQRQQDMAASCLKEKASADHDPLVTGLASISISGSGGKLEQPSNNVGSSDASSDSTATGTSPSVVDTGDSTLPDNDTAETAELQHLLNRHRLLQNVGLYLSTSIEEKDKRVRAALYKGCKEVEAELGKYDSMGCKDKNKQRRRLYQHVRLDLSQLSARDKEIIWRHMMTPM